MKPFLILATVLMATPVFAQTPATAPGNVWHYSLGGYEVDMTFLSDTTLRWQDKTRAETDKSKTLHINDHIRLTGWYESDKTFVSLYSNFVTGEAYCHVFQPNGKIIPMKGTLVLKK